MHSYIAGYQQVAIANRSLHPAWSQRYRKGRKASWTSYRRSTDAGHGQI